MRELGRFLREDLGFQGDITSEAVVGRKSVLARVLAKGDCVVAGLEEADEIFSNSGLRSKKLAVDGSRVLAGTVVLEIRGDAKKVLAGERLALNFLMRMSGIATMTADVVKKCRKINPAIDIAATRKTTPGFRYYEKKAVVLGGGSPHRFGLFDSVLIKDNHLKLVSSIESAIGLAKKKYKNKIVEVEVEDMRQALRALKAGADIIMLDNFAPEDVEATVGKLKELNKDVLIEVSGGITPDNITRYAKWADIISLGALTHSYRSMDFSLEIARTVG
jgi:nicotinate-nucleotide pyrophosphorylase (carboxylating)